MAEFGDVPSFPTVVTDGGGNVSSAVNDILKWNWYRCAAHLVHNVVTLGLQQLEMHSGGEEEGDNSQLELVKHVVKRKGKGRKPEESEEDSESDDDAALVAGALVEGERGGEAALVTLKDIAEGIKKIRGLSKKVRTSCVEKVKFEASQKVNELLPLVDEDGEEIEEAEVATDLLYGTDGGFFDVECGSGGNEEDEGGEDVGVGEFPDTQETDSMAGKGSCNFPQSDSNPEEQDDATNTDVAAIMCGEAPAPPQPPFNINALAPLKLPSVVPTRWNSLYFLLERGVRLKPAIDAYTREHSQKLELSSLEWRGVELLVTFLRAGKDCTSG